MDCREIFEVVSTHLLKQNAKSFAQSTRLDSDDDNVCQYRGFNGTKCAIGCLIPEELYDKKIEGMGVGYDLVLEVGGLPLPDRVKLLAEIIRKSIGRLTTKKLELIEGLQYIHDRSPVEDWEQKLKVIKSEYNL